MLVLLTLQEVGLLVLLSRLLLTLSENDLFMATLVDMPVAAEVSDRSQSRSFAGVVAVVS